MLEYDVIFSDDFSLKWINEIGDFGDIFRMLTINPIALNTIISTTRDGNFPDTCTLIQDTLNKINNNFQSFKGSLDNKNDVISFLEGIYPIKSNTLNGAHIWDLGSGEGYLGRWLGQYGVSGVCVEPSTELNAHASLLNKHSGFSFIDKTAIDYLQSLTNDKNVKFPKLITIIAVLESCSNPNAILNELSHYMSEQDMLDVPILIVTLDQDYFSVGLPKGDMSNSETLLLGKHCKSMLKPACMWEALFRSARFHILEQRPLHIDSLHPAIHTYFHEYFRKSVVNSTPINMVPPRQGPFHFWLLGLSGRKPSKEHNQSYFIGTSGKKIESDFFLEFKMNEKIERIGNLGSFVTYVQKGASKFKEKPNGDEYNFHENGYFGQLEFSQNYFSSRILGDIKAAKKTRVSMWRYSSLVDSSSEQEIHYGELLLQSMVNYFDISRYLSFISIGKSEMPSKKIRDSPSDYCDFSIEEATILRSVSAFLLQKSACQIANESGQCYRSSASRIIIECDANEIPNQLLSQLVAKSNRAYGYTIEYILVCLINSCVVDSYSSHFLVEENTRKPTPGLQDEIFHDWDGLEELEITPKYDHGQIFHIGHL